MGDNWYTIRENRCFSSQGLAKECSFHFDIVIGLSRHHQPIVFLAMIGVDNGGEEGENKRNLHIYTNNDWCKKPSFLVDEEEAQSDMEGGDID